MPTGVSIDYNKNRPQKKVKYRAMIMVKGKRIWLGRFDTEEAAVAAYNQAKQQFKGEQL